MKILNHTKTLRLLALLTAALPICAADQSRWAGLRALRRGERIGVILADQSRTEGVFESVSDDALVLERMTIPQTSVIRVYKPEARRGKRMLIGTAVGLAAGAAVAATVAGRLNNEGFFAGPAGGAGAAASAAGGAGIGLAIGRLSGPGYTTLYQRRGSK